MAEIKALVEGSQTFAVIIGKDATFDHWVTATSLTLALQSFGKSVVLASPVKPDLEKLPELRPLFGLDAVVDHLGKQNLIVSFDYSPEAVDAVSYAIDETAQKFLLTIKPKPGSQPLSGNSVQTSYAGSAVEVLFLIGVHSYDQIGELYLQNQSVFGSAARVSFHQFIPEIAQMSFTVDKRTCMAELVPEVLQEIGIALSPEVASNLLYGIEQQTSWLSSLRTTAETFTTVAALLAAGAKRQPRPKLEPVTPPVAQPQTSAEKSQKPDNKKSVKNGSTK